jgi:hypothetical protein
MTDIEPMLGNGINRALSDCRSSSFDGRTVYGLSHGRIREAFQILQCWEQRGVVRVLVPTHEADLDQLWIEMISYVDMDSPLPGFLNWKESNQSVQTKPTSRPV